MNKLIHMIPPILIMSVLASNAISAQIVNPPAKKDCNITCVEKTPTCYVSQDQSGCLTISNDKPTGNKDTRTCVIPGCETKTTINSKGKVTTTTE